MGAHVQNVTALPCAGTQQAALPSGGTQAADLRRCSAVNVLSLHNAVFWCIKASSHDQGMNSMHDQTTDFCLKHIKEE